MKNYTTPNADMVLVSTDDVLTASIIFNESAGLGDNILDLDTIA